MSQQLLNLLWYFTKIVVHFKLNNTMNKRDNLTLRANLKY